MRQIDEPLTRAPKDIVIGLVVMLLKRLGGEVKISTEEVKALGLLKNTEVWHTSNPDDNTIKVYMK